MKVEAPRVQANHPVAGIPRIELCGVLGIPRYPQTPEPQPFGQFAAPASTSDASAAAERSRYLSLRSFTGLPPFRPVVGRNVTGCFNVWQSESEAPAHEDSRLRAEPQVRAKQRLLTGKARLEGWRA